MQNRKCHRSLQWSWAVKWMKIEIRTSLFLNENLNHFAAPQRWFTDRSDAALLCAAVLFWPSTTPTESSLRATETAAASKETGNSASCCHTSCLTEAVDKCCVCLRCLAFFTVAYMFRREKLHRCAKKTKQGKKNFQSPVCKLNNVFCGINVVTTLCEICR